MSWTWAVLSLFVQWRWRLSRGPGQGMGLSHISRGGAGVTGRGHGILGHGPVTACCFDSPQGYFQAGCSKGKPCHAGGAGPHRAPGKLQMSVLCSLLVPEWLLFLLLQWKEHFIGLGLGTMHRKQLVFIFWHHEAMAAERSAGEKWEGRQGRVGRGQAEEGKKWGEWRGKENWQSGRGRWGEGQRKMAEE